MRIGELSKQSGVEVETIRYYERIGLLAKPLRSANGYRSYDQTALERLAFIRHSRQLDMSLADIQRLLEFVEHPGADCAEVDQLVESQLAQVQARISSLMLLEKQLTALRAQCRAPQDARNCGILSELVAAAQQEGCVCHADSPSAKPRTRKSANT